MYFFDNRQPVLNTLLYGVQLITFFIMTSIHRKLSVCYCVLQWNSILKIRFEYFLKIYDKGNMMRKVAAVKRIFNCNS